MIHEVGTMRQKISLKIWKCFLIVFAAGLLVTIFLCMIKSQDGLLPADMIILPFVCMLGAAAVCAVILRLERFLAHYQRVLLPGCLIIYGIVIFYFGIRSRGNPVHDSLSVINGAKYMAGMTDEMNWTYFARWNNNIMPMVFLSVVFRLGAALRFSDVYYFAVILNTLQVVAALYCVFKISSHYAEHSTAAGWMGMGLLAVYFPIFGFTQSLYTDSMSFCFGIAAFYIWLCNREKGRTGWKYWLNNLAAGILWGIGTNIKVTVVISLIAVFLYLILFDDRHAVLGNLCTVLLPAAVIMIFCSLYAASLPSKEYNDTWGVPRSTTHLGIGLMGDGSWDTDGEFFVGVTEIYGMAEKEAWARQYIFEHLDQFVNADHMIAKLRHNFASGAMNASDFLSTADNHGFVYNCISYEGAYRIPYRKWITAYWYMLLLLCAAACFFHTKKETVDPRFFVPIVTLFGIMLFVMIFEANNRQMYNHLPWIVCISNLGLWALENLFLAKKYR